MKRFRDSVGFACILNLLLPGLGHVYWREYIFGLFVFLVLLLASMLFFVSFLVALPDVAKLLLFALPLLFYLFSFVDLGKTVSRRGPRSRRGGTAVILMLVLAVGFQLLAPIAPLNFALRNRPEIHRLTDNGLNPLLRRGDLIVINSLAYCADLFFLDQPVWYDCPRLGEMICFHTTDSNTRRVGLVVGEPGHEVQVVDGLLFVDGLPASADMPAGLTLRGDMPLTRVAYGSIMVVTLNLGALDEVYHVPIDETVGRVHRLL